MRHEALPTSALLDLVSGLDFPDQEQAFRPAPVHPVNFEPPEDVMISLAVMWKSEHGRKCIEWILDLTMRAPYPVTGQDPNDLQFAAAKHQARAAVGETVLVAIRKGNEVLETRKGSQP